MRTIFILIILTAFTAVTGIAKPIDDARRLYDAGEYEQALEQLQALHRKTPRDGTVNYWLATTLTALDRVGEARRYYETAEERGVADAALALARLDTDAYDPSGANAHYDTYERLMRKNKKTIPDEVERSRSRLVLMENMLARVENIAVVDSLVVDAEEFFRAYRLSPEAGRLVNGATARLPEVEMVFMPQNNTEILYSMPDSLGNYVLMGADILDDGTVDHACPLPGEDLSGGGNAEYPFLLSDGLTLYYASDGEGSLGGYDIFMTRRGDDGYLQPQNVGMPYNSPDDDYLLAIDETTGAGWWATDRNHIPGMLTIYIFIPSDTRVNVAADDPLLVSLARLDDISLTRRGGVDYTAVRERISAIGSTQRGDNVGGAGRAFSLPIGSATRIYHNLSDFSSPQARRLMASAIDARAGIERLENRLEALRQKYREGDQRVASDILDLEDQLAAARTGYDTLVNKAIAAELNK